MSCAPARPRWKRCAVSRWLPDRAVPARVFAVDKAQLAWSRNGNAGASPMATWSYRDGSPGALQEAFGNQKPRSIDVIAGNDVAVHWLQKPPASVASFAELRLVAQARCVHLYGGSPADWRIAGDWHPSRAFVCAALPEDVLLPIEQSLGELGLMPRWHSAWSVLTCGMAQAFPANGWIAVRTPARVVLWHCAHGLVDCITTWSADDQEDTCTAAKRACRQMKIENSRSDCHNSVLNWLDLTAPPDKVGSIGEPAAVVTLQPAPQLAWTTGVLNEAAAALALRSLLASGRR
jgi:hypothetical protein